MNQYNRDDIIRMAQEEDVEFIRLQFTDVLGKLKNVAVTYSQLEKVLNNKCTFDSVSIEGLVKTKQPGTPRARRPWRPHPAA